MPAKISRLKLKIYFGFLISLISLIIFNLPFACAIQTDKNKNDLSFLSNEEIDAITNGKFELYDEVLLSKMISGAKEKDKAAPIFQALLGEYYNQKENYKLSFHYYSKCSGSKWDCDFHLGNLYLDGLGVLQDDDKAIKYFIKSVKGGNSISAYNLSVIYGKKANRFYNVYDQVKMDSFYYNLIRCYAWRKVSMALGNKNAVDRQRGEESILVIYEQLKNMLYKANKLKSADRLADEICSSIPLCAE